MVICIAEVVSNITNIVLSDVVANSSSDYVEFGLDSLDIVEIVIRIEQRFEIELEDADLEECRTLNECCCEKREGYRTIRVIG